MWFIPLILGTVVGGLVVGFWDTIKQWAENILAFVIAAIRTAIEVISDALIFIVKIGDRYYKKFQAFVKNIETNKYESRIVKEEIPESEIPDEIKEQLQMREQIKVGEAQG